MTKKLEHLNWKPKWVSHLGCVKGCIDYLDMEVSDAWLYGATGHAFIINMHEVVCPSGPTAWKSEMLHKLCRNVGYETTGLFSHRDMPDFKETRKKSWDYIRKCIDDGIPCFGWELAVPEYYVINGYDDVGYYFSGPIPGPTKIPKPWDELADGEIGVIDMYSVKQIDPADDATTVKEALRFALEFAESPDKWIFPKYKAGLEGFDLWIKALETDTADGFGNSYNAEVWCECRVHAVEFLKEAKDRLDHSLSGLFDEAIGHYDMVARKLSKVEDLFPFHTFKPDRIKDESRRSRAAELLKKARNHEESGLMTLEKIVAEL